VSRINVVVAATRRDVDAENIADAVARRTDMYLVGGRYVSISDAEAAMSSLPTSERCALVLYGPAEETATIGEDSLAARGDLVVMRVTDAGDVHIGATLHRIGLPELLAELRSLVDRVGSLPGDRAQLVQLRPVSSHDANAPSMMEVPRERPLLNAAMSWTHAVMNSTIESLPEARGDLHWFTLNRTTVLGELGQRARGKLKPIPSGVVNAETALSRALTAADAQTDPLGRASRELGLSFLEFRVLLLVLAPELDPVYQRCVGILLDDVSRRVGTLGLYADLLGSAADVRVELAQTGNLARWRVFEGHGGGLPAADEPLRLDPPLAAWLLGKRGALGHDPRTRRVMRLVPWPGAALLDRHEERAEAAKLLGQLRGSGHAQWILPRAGDPSAWRALLELGARSPQSRLIRVEASRLTGLDVGEVEESGIRLGRMSRLMAVPIVIDATASNVSPQDDDSMRLFLAAVGSTRVGAALLCDEEARFVRLLGSAPCQIEGAVLDQAARIAAVRAAGKHAEVDLTEEAAEAIANRHPLRIDGLEQAMRLARARVLHDAGDSRLERFVAACKEVASEGISRLAERLEPIFDLDDVVLPPDRKRQLVEIVDSVRLAPKVLDGWKFREQLPYGRGVSALFHGLSGTGKTMAAMGVARALGVQILRLDLSKVVSKYIGETEKNLDHVFDDAQRSGSAILIDEAEALLGKRSEVKDAHDRYANIEVAYLLQRMEAYEGLAILTTNMRQNLDPAFLRRLRFIVDFPRPDAEARERIWRRCLPEGSHALDDAAFRQLARRIDLTGGHIRQITLRAAFIAAAGGAKIGLDEIAQAARAELAKLGMPPVDIDSIERRKAA
jgi:ATPase family protein associated with various cellular activities (AAA)/winged helix domain-containing protein